MKHRTTRHQRMKRRLSSGYRAARRRKLGRRYVRAALIELFRSDDRLVPPPWIWDAVYGQQVHRPRSGFVITGE